MICSAQICPCCNCLLVAVESCLKINQQVYDSLIMFSGMSVLCAVFVTLGVTLVLNLGLESNLLMFENLTAHFLFYCAHWQTYVSGTLKFGL